MILNARQFPFDLITSKKVMGSGRFRIPMEGSQDFEICLSEHICPKMTILTGFSLSFFTKKGVSGKQDVSLVSTLDGTVS